MELNVSPRSSRDLCLASLLGKTPPNPGSRHARVAEPRVRRTQPSPRVPGSRGLDGSTTPPRRPEEATPPAARERGEETALLGSGAPSSSRGWSLTGLPGSAAASTGRHSDSGDAASAVLPGKERANGESELVRSPTYCQGASCTRESCLDARSLAAHVRPQSGRSTRCGIGKPSGESQNNLATPSGPMTGSQLGRSMVEFG